MTVKESHEILINDESDKLIEQDKIIKAAKLSTENNGMKLIIIIYMRMRAVTFLSNLNLLSKLT